MTVSTQIGAMIALLNANPMCGGSINAVGHSLHNTAQLAVDGAMAKRTGLRLRDMLLSARRYHLSADVTASASLYGFNVDDPVKDMLNNARIPFDSIWLEWPVASQLGALGVDVTPDAPKFAGVIACRVKGHNSRFMISAVHYRPEEGLVDMAPFSILVDTENPINKAEFAECQEFIYECLKGRIRFASYTSEQLIDMDVDATLSGKRSDPVAPTSFDIEKLLNSTLIGGSLGDGNKVNVGNLTKLFPYAVYCFTPGFCENMISHVRNPASKWHEAMKDLVAEHIAEHSGSMRFVLGALAVLNNKEYVVRSPVKPGHKRPGELIKPKLQPSYEFVSMNTPHIVFIRQIQGQHEIEQRRQRQRHEVTGTWVNYHKTGKPDCEHEFANLDDTGDRKICLLCGHKKSWRVEHQRGNIELGFKKRAARVVVG